MNRSKYFFLAIVIFSIGTVGAVVLPLGSIVCPRSKCRPAVSENTDTIDRSPEVTRIDARLRIAVELLGIVVYRQESDTTEVLRGGRLISLQSLSNKDRLRFEMHGEAQGNQFVVNATSGSFAGPA